MKKISSLILLIMVVILLIIGNIKETKKFRGYIESNDGVEVNISISRSNFEKMLNKVTKNIIVEGKEVYYCYVFSGQVYELEGYYAAPIRRMSETGLATQGFLFFDYQMNNIIIETGQEKIYSCSKVFRDLVFG